jgi:hypothetical protein
MFYKYFRNLSPNNNKTNIFLRDLVLNIPVLFSRFFKIKTNNLSLNSQTIKIYLKDYK